MASITHTFVSGIADDPKAAAAGEVLPSHWNATHTLSGIRSVLTADANYYVRSDGSDSNTGTANTAGGAWLTTQHAINYIAENIDGGGFQVTINIGAGSFVGFFMRTMTGISNLYVIGAGSTSTTLTGTTPDNIFTVGECIAVYVNMGCQLLYNRIKLLQSQNNVDCVAIGAGGQSVFGFDNINTTDVAYAVTAGPSVNQFCIGMYAPAYFEMSGGGMTIGGAGQHSNGVFNLTQGATATVTGVTVTFSGTPTYDIGFVRLLGNSLFNTLGGALTFVGTFTGPKYDIEEGSSLITSGATIPGSLAPVIMGAANTLDDNFLSPLTSTLPSTTDLPGAQEYGVFQISGHPALGPVTSINVSGAIEFIGRVTLKANITFFVRSTGSDSNDGLTSGTAWLTIQHAMNFIAGSLDIAGFLITVDIGAGTFAGFGVVSTVGAGVIQFKGAGSGSTTISNGPNDGVINFGECFDANEACQSVIAIDAVKFAPASALGPLFIIYVPLISAFIGDFVALTSDVAWDFTNCAGVGISVQATGSQIQYLPGTANMTLGGASIASLFDITSFGFFGANTVTFSLSGTLTVSDAFVAISVGSVAQFFSCAVSGGTITGKRFDVNAGGILFDVTPGSLGQTFFPGSSAGVSDNTSSYDLWQGPLLATSTSTSYTLLEANIGGRVEMNNAGANSVLVDTDANFTCPISAEIKITQIGAGATTVSAASTTVTVHNSGAVGGQWKSAVVYKRAANEWVQT